MNLAHSGHRALMIDLDEPVNQKWLEKQPESVQRVSNLNVAGDLYQRPVVEDRAFVDPTAQLIGGMIVSSGCYVGPFAVIRLDEKPTPMPLIIGEDSNVQDCAVIHSTTQQIGKRVIVAHQAVVHGAVLEDDCALYIQAVADGAGTVIGKGAFLDQGSYVGKGIKIGERRYVAPGRKILGQAEADSLPKVPEKVEEIRQHVLELNGSHVKRYLSLNTSDMVSN